MLFLALLSALLAGVHVALCSERDIELIPLIDNMESQQPSYECYEALIDRAYKTNLTNDDFGLLESTSLIHMDSMPVKLKTKLFEAAHDYRLLLIKTEKKMADQELRIAISEKKEVASADSEARITTLNYRCEILRTLQRNLILSGLSEYRAHRLFWKAVCRILRTGRMFLIYKLKEEFDLPSNTPYLEDFRDDNRDNLGRINDRSLIHNLVLFASAILPIIAVFNNVISVNIYTGIAYLLIIIPQWIYIYKFGPGSAGNFAPGLGYRALPCCPVDNGQELEEC